MATSTKSKRPSQSPQARWSRRMKKLGRCSRCGEKRTHYKQLCDRCQGLFTAYVRAWRLSKHQNVQVAITTQS